MVDEVADGDRSGATSAEAQEEKEEALIVYGSFWPQSEHFAALRYDFRTRSEADAHESFHVEALPSLIRLVVGVVALTLMTGCMSTHNYAGPKRPFNVYVADAEIVYEGTIAREGYEHLIDLLQNLESTPDRLTITSGGGNADVGIDLGLLVLVT